MTCLVAPFFLSQCESAPGGAVFPVSLRGHHIFTLCHCEPAPGGRGNLTVPIHTYEYPRDCFVAALLAMTYWCVALLFLCHCRPSHFYSMSLRGRPFFPMSLRGHPKEAAAISHNSSYKSRHSLFIEFINSILFCLEPAFICFSLRMAPSISLHIS